MNPAYQDDWLTIYGGDCRTVLAELPDESVHCVVTSPPYWGLRDYGTATWEGGADDCDHRGPPMRTYKGGAPEEHREFFKEACGKCGAVRIDSQLGLEPTPEQYVENMVAVFREVRRVLRSDGTVWLNLGDSYASSPPGNTTKGVSGSSTLHGVNGESGRYRETLDAGHATKRNTIVGGLKPKDLVGIPWRVAFALQADGWYLRSDIIWSKPNPMPESVTDRPTKSHEYLFLLAKSARYYFDADAVREDDTGGTRYPQKKYAGTNSGLNSIGPPGNGRNIRSVWTVATQPYPGAHFAVFPEKLIEPCILAGCPVDGVVLDPFGGSGTTARVANRLSRRAVLIDLNPDYLKQQMDRNRDIPLGLGA